MRSAGRSRGKWVRGGGKPLSGWVGGICLAPSANSPDPSSRGMFGDPLPFTEKRVEGRLWGASGNRRSRSRLIPSFLRGQYSQTPPPPPFSDKRTTLGSLV